MRRVFVAKENWAEYWKVEAITFEKRYNDLLKVHNDFRNKVLIHIALLEGLLEAMNTDTKGEKKDSPVCKCDTCLYTIDICHKEGIVTTTTEDGFVVTTECDSYEIRG